VAVAIKRDAAERLGLHMDGRMTDNLRVNRGRACRCGMAAGNKDGGGAREARTPGAELRDWSFRRRHRHVAVMSTPAAAAGRPAVATVQTEGEQRGGCDTAEDQEHDEGRKSAHRSLSVSWITFRRQLENLLTFVS
jgi:hypothetical protein